MNTLAVRNDTTVYKLVQIGSDAMLRAFVPSYLVYRDTLSLSNRINLKFSIQDTANHWLSIGYVPDWNTIVNKPNFLDSTTIYSIINGKLAIADTIGRWTSIGRFVSDSINIQAKLDLKMDKADSILFYPRFSNPAVYIKSTDTGGKWLAASTHIPVDPVNANWASISGLSQILNKPSLATVATSGSYNDLTSKPTIPSAQVNSDWTAVSGISQILNKPTLASVATSGSYNDLTSKPTIPAAQVQSDWNASNGLGVILNKPTIPTVPTNVSAFTNDAGYLTGITSGQITTALGYTPYNGTTNPNGYLSSITSLQINSALGYTLVTNARTITINGTTQDLTANRTWNVGDILSTGSYSNPSWLTALAWSKITGTPTTLSGYGITDGVTSSSLTSILAGYTTTSSLTTALSSYATTSALTSGLSGKVDNTRTLTINGTALDLSVNRSWSVGTVTSAALATGTTGTDINVSGSPVTSSGSITLNVPTASATNRGALSSTDWTIFNSKQAALTLTTTGSGAATLVGSTLNIPTPTAPTFNNAPARSLNTSFQVSTTNNSRVSYSVTCATGVALLNLNSAAQVFLEISANNSTWVTIAGGGSTQTLAVALSVGINTSTTQNLQCEVPAGYWVRLRTVTSGGATTAFASGQEVTY